MVRAAADAAARVEAVCSGEDPPAVLQGVCRPALGVALAALLALRAGAPCCRHCVQPHACEAEAVAAAAALAAAPAGRVDDYAPGAPAVLSALAFALLRAGVARAHPRFDVEQLGRHVGGAHPGFEAREGLACVRVLALAGGTHAAPSRLLERLASRGGPLLDELAPPAAAARAGAPALALHGIGAAVRAARAPPPGASPSALELDESDGDAAAGFVLDGLEALCVAARAVLAVPITPHAAALPSAARAPLVDVDASALAFAMRAHSAGTRTARGARFRALCSVAKAQRIGDAAAVLLLPPTMLSE